MLCIVLSVCAIVCAWFFLCVVVPLPPGTNPFAVNSCNNKNNKSFRSHYGPKIDSDFNINEYQESFLGGKGGRCVGLTTL